jgi:hypothetical protein
VALVRRLLGGRKDHYAKIDADSCQTVEAPPGELELLCKAYDGCLGACRDRVLTAVIHLAEGRAPKLTLGESTTDTGACGCCMHEL